jgi:hypothetical protein
VFAAAQRLLLGANALNRCRDNRCAEGVSVTALREGISVMSLFYVSPGLLFFLACSVPAIYFSQLLKQHSYCIEVVRHNINRGIA